MFNLIHGHYKHKVKRKMPILGKNNLCFKKIALSFFQSCFIDQYQRTFQRCLCHEVSFLQVFQGK